ncbi:MAG: hypothetical protein KDA50_09905 [Rhodobacteraceae bacterium]|nr:hypothetical protein [Paracoccaceae bacterium]
MAGATTTIVALQGLSLPPDAAQLRDHVRVPARRTDHYLTHYDRTTLFYDCVRMGNGRDLLLTAPPAMNLEPLLMDGLRQGDGTAIRKRVTRGPKYLQMVLRGPVRDLALQDGTALRPVQLRDSLQHLFAGLNCAVCMNKNNPLDWIQGWAAHHVRLHRLEGVLIFDNGSTAYGADDLAAALARVPGLKQAVIAQAPFPYGTTDKVAKGETRPNFLQPALLNLARRDFLCRARAVLNCDIDELVMSRDGSSVFDRAASRPWGAARLPVFWAYPAPGAAGPVAQWHHDHRPAAPQRTPRKWCVAPGGLLSRTGWFVHHVGGEFFKLNRESRAHEVVHCRATSTGWHPFKSRADDTVTLRPDPELAAIMAPLAALMAEISDHG